MKRERLAVEVLPSIENMVCLLRSGLLCWSMNLSAAGREWKFRDLCSLLKDCDWRKGMADDVTLSRLVRDGRVM